MTDVPQAAVLAALSAERGDMDARTRALAVLNAAAPHLYAAERERIRQLAIKHQATYWVGPDDSLAPRRPFALLLQFGELEEDCEP